MERGQGARLMLPTSMASSRPTSCQQVPWSMLNSSESAGPSVSCLATTSSPPWSPYLSHTMSRQPDMRHLRNPCRSTRACTSS